MPLNAKTKKPQRQRRRSAATGSPRDVIRAMLAAGVEFRFLPGGGLVVRGLGLLAPDLRGAFLDGPGADLHRAAREILTD